MKPAEVFRHNFIRWYPVAYYPTLEKITGSVKAALFLSQLLYWADHYSDKEGWISKTQKEIRKITGLTRREQERARRVLKSVGIVKERTYNKILQYRIDYRVLYCLLKNEKVLDDNKLQRIYKAEVKKLLGRPIAFYVLIARAVGSVKCGIFLSQLLYWQGKQNNKQGWIYKTRDEIYRETGLKRREQEQVRRYLKGLNVLEEKKGRGNITFYKVNWNVVEDLLYKIYPRGRGDTEAFEAFIEFVKNYNFLEADGTKGTLNNAQKGPSDGTNGAYIYKDYYIEYNKNTVCNKRNKKSCTPKSSSVVRKEGKSRVKTKTLSRNMSKNSSLIDEEIKFYVTKYNEFARRNGLDEVIVVSPETKRLFKQQFRAFRELFLRFDEILKHLEESQFLFYRESELEINFRWVIENIHRILDFRKINRNSKEYVLYMKLKRELEKFPVENNYYVLDIENGIEFYRKYLFKVLKGKTDDFAIRDDANNRVLISKLVLTKSFIKKLKEATSATED